jgi:hypothetical protein
MREFSWTMANPIKRSARPQCVITKWDNRSLESAVPQFQSCIEWAPKVCGGVGKNCNSRIFRSRETGIIKSDEKDDADRYLKPNLVLDATALCCWRPSKYWAKSWLRLFAYQNIATRLCNICTVVLWRSNSNTLIDDLVPGSSASAFKSGCNSVLDLGSRVCACLGIVP